MCFEDLVAPNQDWNDLAAFAVFEEELTCRGDIINAGLGCAIHGGKLNLRRNGAFSGPRDLEQSLSPPARSFHDAEVLDTQSRSRLIIRNGDDLAIMSDAGVHG